MMKIPDTSRRLFFAVFLLTSCWTAAPMVSAEGKSPPLLQIGTQRQLFIDSYIIQSLKNARQVLNPADKHPQNPVLRNDRPWEGALTGPSRVIYDEDEGLFRMWYRTTKRYFAKKGGEMTTYDWVSDRTVRRTVEVPYSYDLTDDEWLICYAVSRDGVHWEKPSLGRAEFNNSKENNILPKENMVPLFKDHHETDPAKRYKTIHKAGTTTGPGMQLDLFYSPDGFEWTPYENNPVLDTSPRRGRWGPTVFMGWDPIRGVYAVHVESCLHRRCRLGKRVIGRAESPDMIRWSQDQTILIPDEKDFPDTEFYNMPAITYHGIYIGMLWNFRTTNTLHYPELVVSRDGIHYERNYREPFVRPGDHGDFDETTVYVLAPIVHDGKVWIYYEGGNWRGPEALYRKGKEALHAAGLATLAEDAFVSVDAGKLLPGELVTHFFSFEGNELSLNMKAAWNNAGAGQPELKVGILDSDLEPIAGFTLAESDPVRTTGRHRMSWRGKSDVSALAGQPVQLRIHIRNAKLYSFQFGFGS